MTGYVTGDSSSQHDVIDNSSINKVPSDIYMDEFGGGWYLSRKEIEENSPSRRDGIDLKKETYFRKLYCAFLQDLGMRLKVPQVTIATAVVFCHRFFLRHSHAQHDRRKIATACMFLAGKVEETPRPLKDVIMVSFEIIHKKDPAAAQKIKQKEVYEQQKELILLGERIILSTLAFDMNVHHPYKPLVEAIKKFKVAQNALAQVAWNFVNDGLRTSLCLQFKPHHIAAGAIFLAAKFLKVKLPSDGEKVWWQEFDVTPRQLEEVSNQMLELYEQNKLPQGSEIEVSGGAVHNQRGPIKTSTVSDELVSNKGPIPASGGSVSSSGKPEASKNTSSRSGADQVGNQSASLKTEHIKDDGSTEMSSVINEHKLDEETKYGIHAEFTNKDNDRELPNRTEIKQDKARDDDTGDLKGTDSIKPVVDKNLESGEHPVSHSPHDALKTLDTDKWKAQAEKMRKYRLDISRKKVVDDEDDLLEIALEDGVESAVEDERMKHERRQGRLESKDQDPRAIVNASRGAHIVEEGEMLDEPSPMMNSRKRKGSPLSKTSENKHPRAYMPGHHCSDSNSHNDGYRTGKEGSYGERELRSTPEG